MRKTKEEALLTKKIIVSKAVKLFKQKGFIATTLEEIAVEANVTRGAIYWHFKDKLDIVDELINKERENMTHMLTSIFEEEISPYSKIQKAVDHIVKHFFGSESFRDFIDITWFKIEYSQLSRLKESKAEMTDYFINTIEALAKDAQTMGEIKKELDAFHIAITITNMINGMYRLYFIMPGRGSTEKEAMDAFTTYLNLIKTNFK
ncbi:MAG: TetR family transcriptional regulator [Cyclobacteriaceae bacterium]|nr:TetR family transcriptional regulator [Cyclobacteriaceae bacterium]